MRIFRPSIAAATVALLVLLLGGTGTSTAEEAKDTKPPYDPDVTAEQVTAAIDRGVAFLLEAQHENGSWGSPAPTLYLDIRARVPGSHRAFHVASCALALSGLIEAGGERPGVEKAIARAADWLVAHHEVRRSTPMEIYNNWAHAYSLEAFARLLAREEDPERRRVLLGASAAAVDRLRRYEYVDGGWGYYDFGYRLKKPGYGGANSFTTSTALVALRMAQEQGVEVPARLIRRAKTLVRASRLPGGAYAYGFNCNPRVPYGVNKLEGSLARTPACQAGLLAWKEPIPLRRVVKAFDALEEHGHFLRIARKYPYPHETWFQNSGYFCFYGYYYASGLLGRLPDEKRLEHAGRIAAHLLPIQEPDGSWWDYQLYRFHKFYGTGYVLTTLQRCLDAQRCPDPQAPIPDAVSPESQ